MIFKLSDRKIRLKKLISTKIGSPQSSAKD